MTKRRQAMLQRRQELLGRIAGQREQLAELGAGLQPLFRVADQAGLAVRFLRAHAVLAAGLAGLVLVRRRGVSALVKGGWRVWKLYRYVNEVAGKIRTHA